MSARARHRIDVHNLQQELVDAQDHVESLIADYQDAAEAEHRARAIYETKRARTLLAFPKGERSSEDIRKARVRGECWAEEDDWQHLVVNLEVVRRATRAAESRVDVIRTLIASERALLS